MSFLSRFAFLRPLQLVVLLLALVVAGCQQLPSPAASKPADTWWVLERVGEVRAMEDTGERPRSLRPGDRVGGGDRVITGDAAVLILARDGVQLSASENTTIRLSGPARTDLTLERGSLRLRLARPVDREARIQTNHLDIHASVAILELRADDHGSDLSVESGSAVLATKDGGQRATLVAGAAAKIDPGQGHDLLIRAAASEPFTGVTPFPSTSAFEKADEKGSKPVPSRPDSMPEPSTTGRLATAGSTDDATKVIILPASHQKVADTGPQTSPPSSGQIVSEPTPARSSPPAMEPSPPSLEAAAMAATSPRPALIKVNGLEPPSPGSDVEKPATIQENFDLLTDGLIDGL